MKKVTINGKTYSEMGGYEPRRLTDNELAALFAGVKDAGLAVVVVSKDREILAGHHEWRAAARWSPPIPVEVVTIPVTDPVAKRFLARSLCRWGHSRPRADMREAIEAEVRADPNVSPGVIADRVLARVGRRPDRKTVSRIWVELRNRGEIPQLATWKGADGKNYPSPVKRKSKPGK